MALQSSQRLPELLFYTKKSYRILQLQFYKGTHPPYTIHPHTCAHYTTSREFSIQNPIPHAEDKGLFKYYYYYIQRAKRPSFQKRNSMHRRQGDLLEIHPCVPRTFPGIPAARSSKGIPVFPDIPVFPVTTDIPDIPVFPVFPDIPVVPDIPDTPVIHDLPAFPGNSTNSSISRDSNPFQHSPIRMHILQFDWFPQKNSTEYQLSNYKHSTNIHSSKKGRCCDIGQTCIGKKRCQDDIFSRIELITSIVLSSKKTNYKNDIQ